MSRRASALDASRGAAIAQWWQQPDHFDWLSAYITDRGLQRVTRFVIGGSAASLGIIAAGMIATPVGPRGVIAETASLVASGLGLVLAVLWLFRWPPHAASAVFAAMADGCIATVCLAQSDPVVGVMGCTAFATMGGYLALFHNARWMAYHVMVTAGTTTALSVRLVGEQNLALVGCLALLVATVNLSVPFVIQLLVHLLGVDVLESDHDPLTQLFNRRGFDRAARELLGTNEHPDGAHLIVSMVDLDRFKRLNDTHGHATGDAALIAVAQVLRARASTTAVIGRTGGEEFLIADILEKPDPAAANGLCDAIAGAPYPITASVGTSAAVLDTRNDEGRQQLLAKLIDIADAAMYEAKRAGGNSTRHRCG